MKGAPAVLQADGRVCWQAMSKLLGYHIDDLEDVMAALRRRLSGEEQLLWCSQLG